MAMQIKLIVVVVVVVVRKPVSVNPGLLLTEALRFLVEKCFSPLMFGAV